MNGRGSSGGRAASTGSQASSDRRRADEAMALPPPNRNALNGMGEFILAQVRRGASDQQWADWLKTPFEHACLAWDMSTVRRLLEAGVNGPYDRPRDPRMRRHTLLHVASACGNTEVVNTLLRWGSHPDVSAREPGDKAYTALHRAALGGHSDVARTLIKAGADKDAKTGGSGATAMHLAARKGHEACVRTLLLTGADRDSRRSLDGATPLHQASFFGQVGAVRALLHGVANPNAQDAEGCTPIFLAAQEGHQEVVQDLLANGALPDVSREDLWTPLHAAARFGHASTALVLLNEGRADIDAATGDHGSTPLHVAAISGFDEVLTVLMDVGSDLESADSGGWTPLHCACAAARASCVNALMARGADPTALTPEGQPPSELIGTDLAEGEEPNEETNESIWRMLRIPRAEIEARQRRYRTKHAGKSKPPPPYNDRPPPAYGPDAIGGVGQATYDTHMYDSHGSCSGGTGSATPSPSGGPFRAAGGPVNDDGGKRRQRGGLGSDDIQHLIPMEEVHSSPVKTRVDVGEGEPRPRSGGPGGVVAAAMLTRQQNQSQQQNTGKNGGPGGTPPGRPQPAGVTSSGQPSYAGRPRGRSPVSVGRSASPVSAGRSQPSRSPVHDGSLPSRSSARDRSLPSRSPVRNESFRSRSSTRDRSLPSRSPVRDESSRSRSPLRDRSVPSRSPLRDKSLARSQESAGQSSSANHEDELAAAVAAAVSAMKMNEAQDESSDQGGTGASTPSPKSPKNKAEWQRQAPESGDRGRMAKGDNAAVTPGVRPRTGGRKTQKDDVMPRILRHPSGGVTGTGSKRAGGSPAKEEVAKTASPGDKNGDESYSPSPGRRSPPGIGARQRSAAGRVSGAGGADGSREHVFATTGPSTIAKGDTGKNTNAGGVKYNGGGSGISPRKAGGARGGVVAKAIATFDPFAFTNKDARSKNGYSPGSAAYRRPGGGGTTAGRPE